MVLYDAEMTIVTEVPTDEATASWKPMIVLGAAQFLMVLDSAVMNVSVSQLVEDFDTEITAIQAVITLYSLVMAATMITGGKLGDLFGRRRAFRIGLVVYGIGSGITAISSSVTVLMFGWSLLEGLGAALVLPAMAAMVGGTYVGRQRALAYGILGGLAGAGVAVGPILGGYFTANLSWRWVFVGEALIVIVLLLLSGWLDEPTEQSETSVDWVGAGLSAAGLGLVVYAVLQSSSWGWLEPRASPVEPLGFSLTPFMIGAGVLLLWMFTVWQNRREEHGQEPLVHLSLLRILSLRSGLIMLLAQNLVLLGLFFSIPLYLQITQGLDALETGVRLLPVSIAMLAFAMSGPLLLRFFSPRNIVRFGLLLLFFAGLLLVGTIQPELDDTSFAISMAVLGVGMGLLASQLGNVVQSSVGDDARSEVGGLQYTAQNLGSALGTALVGAILLGSLTNALITNIENNPDLPESVTSAADVSLSAGVEFVSTADVAAALETSDLSADEQQAIVDDYADAQMQGLKVAIFGISAVALLALFSTGNLPGRKEDEIGHPDEQPDPQPA